MRRCVVALALLCLAGCHGTTTFAGIEEPDDAVAVMLGSRPTRQGAACIGRLLGTTPTDENGAFVGAGPGAHPVTYRVHAIDDRYNRYTTQVDQIGLSAPNEPLVSRCILPGPGEG